MTGEHDDAAGDGLARARAAFDDARHRRRREPVPDRRLEQPDEVVSRDALVAAYEDACSRLDLVRAEAAALEALAGELRRQLDALRDPDRPS